MPLIDANLKSSWDEGYTGGFTRNNEGLVFGMKNGAAILRERLGVTPGQTVVMIGAGFGWEAEEWIAAGLGPITCCDNSTYIQERLADNATLPILDYIPPGPFDLAVSLDCMPWMTNDECHELAAIMRGLSGRVAHLISPGGINNWPVGNWRSLEDWKAFFGTDTIVERGYDYRTL